MVLREQWNNLEGGMIRKDQFKLDQSISQGTNVCIAWVVLSFSSLSCVGGVRGAYESPGCKNGEKLWLAFGPLGILVKELQQETSNS